MKINVSATEKIQAAIDNAEGKARVRQITAQTVSEWVQRIERTLEARLFKADWTGLAFWVDEHAQSFPGAYKGTPESTQFRLERTASGWFVTEVKRDVCSGPKGRVVCLNIDSKAAELAKFARTSW